MVYVKKETNLIQLLLWKRDTGTVERNKCKTISDELCFRYVHKILYFMLLISEKEAHNFKMFKNLRETPVMSMKIFRGLFNSVSL